MLGVRVRGVSCVYGWRVVNSDLFTDDLCDELVSKCRSKGLKA